MPAIRWGYLFGKVGRSLRIGSAFLRQLLPLGAVAGFPANLVVNGMGNLVSNRVAYHLPREAVLNEHSANDNVLILELSSP